MAGGGGVKGRRSIKVFSLSCQGGREALPLRTGETTGAPTKTRRKIKFTGAEKLLVNDQY